MASMAQMELPTFNLDCKQLEAIDIFSYPIDPDLKDHYHRLGRCVLKQLAIDLGLNEDSYEIKSLYGGPAVAGDISLHADHLYVDIGSTAVPAITARGLSQNCRVMYRYCRDRKDSFGGRNHWCLIEDLTDPVTRDAMRALARTASP